MNPKSKFIDIQRRALLGRLEQLRDKLENPNLTQEQFQAVKAEVEECQKKFKELSEFRG